MEADDARGAHVVLRRVGKHFGGVQALKGVDLTIERGSIHGLVGENGAGKSTLGRILAGVLPHDGGEMVVSGRPVSYRSPRDALGDGTAMVQQEMVLVPELSVLQNVFLGLENGRLGMLQDGKLKRRFEELIEQAGFDLPAGSEVVSLHLADQQQVEILRALARNAQLIVMDEPTASLGADDTERLLGTVRWLKEKGTTVLYISHFLEEVLEIADTVTVMRDGEVVKTSATTNETKSSLITAMLGKPLEMHYPAIPAPSQDAPVVLSVDGLGRTGAVADASFEIRAGEILGVAGLVGSGRSELARLLFGADQSDSGSISLNGKELGRRSPVKSIRSGISFVPESRKDDGLLMERSIAENVSLASLGGISAAGWVNRRIERVHVTSLIDRLNVMTQSIGADVQTLSGGNQQKVMFARWMLTEPTVLIADEPTRGVDVGAKHAIYEVLQELSAAGIAIFLISSEFEEVLELAHRIVVMRRGRIVSEFNPDDVEVADLIHAAFGETIDDERATATS